MSPSAPTYTPPPTDSASDSPPPQTADQKCDAKVPTGNLQAHERTLTRIERKPTNMAGAVM